MGEFGARYHDENGAFRSRYSQMTQTNMLEVKPFASASEYEGMIDYFLQSEDSFLAQMGVARALLPSREAWLRSALRDHELPDNKKDRLYVGWYHRGTQVGHSSVNRIKVGEEAYLHLHLWRSDLRKSGFGVQFCRASIAIYFERLKLQRLWSEPYAENPAPNRTLVKLGFSFIRRYRTVPGQISFEQDVNLYLLEM